MPNANRLINKDLKKITTETKMTQQLNKSRFFVISYYGGNLDILKYTEGNHLVYFKGDENRGAYELFKSEKKRLIENTGFNIATYLIYIIEHYDNLPEIMIFCKNNVYPRHVTEPTFGRLAFQNIYTPLVEPEDWKIRFPIAPLTSAQDYLEINDSFYSKDRRGRYFNEYDAFYKYLFPFAHHPVFNRFTPGANFVVPKENVLNRTRSFYQNLLSFINYETHALECYFVERSLDSIFTSSLKSNDALNKTLAKSDLEELCQRNARSKNLRKFGVQSVKRRLGYALIQWIYSMIFAKRH